MRRERLGIFGGTFNPPHIGHRHAAEAFVREATLDNLLVIPDYLPPHKEYAGEVTAKERFDMTCLAFRGIPRTEVSDAELRRGGKSYTSDTLASFASPERDLFLLTGTDMFLTLPAWHEPQKIFALAEIVCIRRERDDRLAREIEEAAAAYRTTYGARVRLLSAPVVEVSSTELRRGLALRAPSVAELLPEGVYAYIKERGLYL